MKVVIDTNCLVASINRHRPEHWLYNAFIDEAFEWLISNEIMTEYTEVISDLYSKSTADVVMELLLVADNVILQEPSYKWQLIVDDPDDNKFADLAIGGNVDFLVTNDRHFEVLRKNKFPPVKVISLEEFRKIVGY
jgi:putative PIN family toxin of toxin-antitoxin system